MPGPGGRKTVSVVWELSDEGKVVVDVDAPLRPFGEVTPPLPSTPPPPNVHEEVLPALSTPPFGTLQPHDETEPDAPVVTADDDTDRF